MSAKTVENLEVFRRAYGLSLEIHRASLEWPRVEQHGGIASQVRRSAKSVCALLVEGVGRLRRSRVEFERYLALSGDGAGSADEARLWCRYAEDFGYAAPGQAAGWRDSYAEIARMLQGLLERQRDKLAKTSPDH